jgi:hypothetical protein
LYLKYRFNRFLLIWYLHRISYIYLVDTDNEFGKIFLIFFLLWFSIDSCRMEILLTLMSLCILMYAVRCYLFHFKIYFGYLWGSILFHFLQGYHGDTSKTFFCGDVDETAQQLVLVLIYNLLDATNIYGISKEKKCCFYLKIFKYIVVVLRG